MRRERRTDVAVVTAALCVAALSPAAGAVSPASVTDAHEPLEEIVVTASLRPEPVQHFPASTTVLDASTLHAAGLQHFEDVLGLVPNLNWAGGTSRPRYFQLRGVGELEQYQGAPNPSVGFLIDGIDLSGVGMPATTFDVAQVEVLRGPQGTRYGANALAGLIKINTHEPEAQTVLSTEATVGDDGVLGAGVVAGSAIGRGGSAAWRIAAQTFQSDGFRHNVYLGRDDTNDRNETTVRGKLRVGAGSNWTLDATAMYVDLDNGYDVFTIDNSFTTRSDRPGQDAQRTAAASLIAHGRLDAGEIVSTTAYADSDIAYSFDGDWASDAYWADVAPAWFAEFGPYDYFSRFERERRTLSEDLRWISASTAADDGHGWVLGVYALRLDEDNRQQDDFAGEPFRRLDSSYSATNVAAYGEFEWRVASRGVLSTGLRVEKRTTDYADSDGDAFDPGDTMLGGHISFAWTLDDHTTSYVTASRGYKAGGFNIGALVPADRRTFDPEYLWNAELGVRRSSERWSADLALFYMWREQEQVAHSFQVVPGDPLSYIFYTDNAASGRNYGLEASTSWRPVDTLTLQATLGLLESAYLGYNYDRFGEQDLDGREQAHAPSWQYSLSAQWKGTAGWLARADVNGSDAFYFDASNDQRSKPYTLVNLKAGYEAPRWAAYLWGRNVFDENYAVRGYYFGLEPPNFPDKLYVHRGDPRSYGVSVEWRLR